MHPKKATHKLVSNQKMTLSVYGILRMMKLLIKKQNAVASTPTRTNCRSGGSPPGMRIPP